MMANRFDTITFLEEYQQFPCLWKKKSPDFKNRVKRDHAEEILLPLSGLGNVRELRQKIRNIRCTYNQEVTKIRKSMGTGSGASEVYQPKLAWFATADSFLRQNREENETESNLKNKVNTQGDIQFRCLNEESSGSSNSPAVPAIDDTKKRSSTYRRSTSLIALKRAKIDKSTTLDSNEKTLQELREISKKLETPADDNEFDCFGKSIACQLKKLPERLALESMAYIQSYLVQQRLDGCNSNNQYSVVDHNEGN